MLVAASLNDGDDEVLVVVGGWRCGDGNRAAWYSRGPPHESFQLEAELELHCTTRFISVLAAGFQRQAHLKKQSDCLIIPSFSLRNEVMRKHRRS